MKKFINKYRWSHSWYDLCGDGRFKKERLKGKDKRIARKRTLKKIKERMEEEKNESSHYCRYAE